MALKTGPVLRLRPTMLPRGFTFVIVAVVYHPPGSDPLSMTNHHFNSLSHAAGSFPSRSLIVAGNFNRLDISSLKRHFNCNNSLNLPLEAKQHWTSSSRT